MKFNNYLYKIAGISLICQLPFEITIQEESQEFLQLLEGEHLPEGDIYLTLRKAEEPFQVPEGGYEQQNRYYIHQDQTLHTYYYISRGSTAFLHTIKKEEENKIEGEYITEYEKELCYSHNLFEILSFEIILHQFQGFLLHSALIDWNHRGILFTAPSGTGKSTQADLWKIYRNAEILNGDRAAIRKVQKKWIAYGLPYAGTSGIYRQRSVEIEAVVVLKQAPVNQIQRLSIMEAFHRIYPEVSIHRWDPVFTNQATDLIFSMLGEIPIYQLSCRPDEEAVQVLEEQLRKNGGHKR